MSHQGGRLVKSAVIVIEMVEMYLFDCLVFI